MCAGLKNSGTGSAPANMLANSSMAFCAAPAGAWPGPMRLARRLGAALVMTVQIVAKRGRLALEVLPARWFVERTFA
jgi:lauroyl/myristoyl acyltransferase